MSLSVYSDEYLIEMPIISSSRTPSARMICESLAELLAPLPDSLIGENDAALSHQQFNVSVAEREAKVEPDTVADDLRWGAMTAI